MYWNELNKDNIEIAKELYYDYLEQNKNEKYSNELESFEEFLENNVTKCDKCGRMKHWDNLKFDGQKHLCQECWNEMNEVIGEPDNYEYYKLREEGLL